MIWAFIRIGTNSRLWRNPLPTETAFAIADEWLAQPRVVVLEPGPLHMQILENLVSEYGARGPQVTDAVLAALAIEFEGVLASADKGFGRFRGLPWVNPLDK